MHWRRAGNRAISRRAFRHTGLAFWHSCGEARSGYEFEGQPNSPLGWSKPCTRHHVFGTVYAASEAYDMGLINFIHERDVIESACIDYAKTIASNAPLTVKTAKAALTPGSEAAALMKSQRFAPWSMLVSTADYREGARRLRANERPNSKTVNR